MWGHGGCLISLFQILLLIGGSRCLFYAENWTEGFMAFCLSLIAAMLLNKEEL